jgi:hypothetical protein
MSDDVSVKTPGVATPPTGVVRPDNGVEVMGELEAVFLRGVPEVEVLRLLGFELDGEALGVATTRFCAGSDLDRAVGGGCLAFATTMVSRGSRRYGHL